MARSLTVKHTENPETSSLFNGFLLLAFGWLVMGMVVAAFSVSDADAAEQPELVDF
ncbi:MAG: hypothetical protein GY913_27905 [Proteobacteria bacterium]|nr:hypothetical protein [Pseudomonadota bacterium]MCP4920735.1 hypothetical protein [Pseudomonadota bacterium]